MILDAQTKVSALIKALHDAAPAMFNPLIEQIVEQEHPQSADAGRITAYQGLLFDYMRLLDKLNGAWNQLVVAARQPSNPASLTALAVASGQIAADAATVRQSLSTLRLGTGAK